MPMRKSCCCQFAGCVAVLLCLQLRAATEILTSLAQFDATVLPTQERQAAARMLEQDMQRRLRESNERSSAEWKNITSRAEWERLRKAKLAALRNSLGQPATPVPL